MLILEQADLVTNITNGVIAGYMLTMLSIVTGYGIKCAFGLLKSI